MCAGTNLGAIVRLTSHRTHGTPFEERAYVYTYLAVGTYHVYHVRVCAHVRARVVCAPRLRLICCVIYTHTHTHLFVYVCVCSPGLMICA